MYVALTLVGMGSGGSLVISVCFEQVLSTGTSRHSYMSRAACNSSEQLETHSEWPLGVFHTSITVLCCFYHHAGGYHNNHPESFLEKFHCV